MQRRTRTGNVAIQIAIAMTVLLGVTAVVIDIGRGRVFKHQARNTAEAAAHAGAAQLDGTVAGIAAARAKAAEVGALNLVAGESIVLDENAGNDPTGDIVTGYWEDEVFVPSTTPMETTSVQVVARSPNMNTFFAGIAFNEPTMDIGDFAIAQAGGPSASACPFPIALPDCEILNNPGGLCGAELSFSSARIDNGAWARIGASQANASWIRDSLDPNVCAAQASTSDNITLNNGQVNSAFRELGDAVNAYGSMWDAAEYGTLPPQSAGSIVSPYGKSLVGQIMVFEDPDNCTDTQFSGNHPLVGFATIIIYDVVNQGSNKEIKARTLCTISDGQGGGGFFGTTVPPNFVR